jgi:hypothetical protein
MMAHTRFGDDDYFLSVVPRDSEHAASLAAVRLEFHVNRVRSCSDLLRCYDDLSNDAKFVALCIFMSRRYRRSVDRLFREMKGTRPELSGAASAALAMIGGTEVLRRLLRSIGAPARVRPSVVSALAHIRARRGATALTDALIKILEGRRVSRWCKSIAAGGLYNAVRGSKRRARCLQKAIRALQRAATDPQVKREARRALRLLRQSQRR